MAENLGVNCKNWVQILQCIPKFPEKFIDLRFKQSIVPTSGKCADDVSVFRIFSSKFQCPKARLNWSKVRFECKNITVHHKCLAVGVIKFCSLL